MNPEEPGQAARERFRLGDRWITPGANDIDGIHVDPKSMDVLLALIEAAPSVMSGQALLDRVWSGVVVVPNVVYQTIAQLRKALGDDAHAPRYIQTISRRGYRIIAEIAPAQAVTATDDFRQGRRRRHNLPFALTSFVGRRRELAEVEALLSSHPLVTLTGVGGCGKTRLALASATARLDDFPDGVWLVELAAVADAAALEPLVASTLGVQMMPGLSLRDSLLVALEGQQRLVVLDNCEHLIEACAGLAGALLRRLPGLRILATSREPLGIAGEHPLKILPFEVPEQTIEPAVRSLADNDSVQLFVERAGLSSPGFAVTAENGSAIASICRAVDGIPLALELAAARLHALSVEDIASHLATGFRLLIGGNRTALPQHRTLQATLDWSYALLSEPSRVLLRRLSVFANGFTMKAAKAVGGDNPLGPDDVLDLLTRLVEQSMVQVVSAAGATSRYRLLEPVRQYARMRLKESGESAAARDRHRDYFVALGEELMDESHNGSRVDLYPRFEAEFDNFELALNWCLETDTQMGLRLAISYCKIAEAAAPAGDTWRRGRLKLKEFLTRTPASAPMRAWALTHVTSLPLTDLDLKSRRELLEQALTLVRHDSTMASGTREILEVTCRTKLGIALIALREKEAGARLIESALTMARDSGDPHALAWCLMNLSWQGNATTDGYADECIAAFRRTDNDVGLARALRRRCEMSLLGESFESMSREWGDELLELARAQGNSDMEMRAEAFIAILTEQEGDPDQAVKLLEQSVERMPKGVWRNHYELGRMLVRLGNHARAESVLRGFLAEALKLVKPSRLIRDDDTSGSPYATRMEQWLFAIQPTVRQEQEWALALALLGFALIAGMRRQYPKAARLYGASMHYRDRLRFGIYATEQSLHDKIIPRVESALGDHAWAGLRAEGAAMSVEQLTALAMLNERADVLPLGRRRG